MSSTEKILKIINDDAMVQIVCGAREISSKNMLPPPEFKKPFSSADVQNSLSPSLNALDHGRTRLGRVNKQEQ
ncbi:MAG: hypothetical protein DMG57_34085 [Acidobacteria bacterium]|nr:MAG: hypothetical protein DMG57_34085 [Acidobacteriota bacterium]